MMHEERPAEPLGDIRKLRAMGLEALLVLRDARLSTRSATQRSPPSRLEEFGAALIGQRLLGWVEDLHEVAADAVAGERFEALARAVAIGVEEVAEQR